MGKNGIKPRGNEEETLNIFHALNQYFLPSDSCQSARNGACHFKLKII